MQGEMEGGAARLGFHSKDGYGQMQDGWTDVQTHRLNGMSVKQQDIYF
jgi:hypothetical protein